MTNPLGYFITWSCYGARLHGAVTGTTDRHHRSFGSDPIPSNPGRELAAMARMSAPAFALDRQSRDIVLRTILEVCVYRGAHLWAAHVRTNHVHVVVSSSRAPERLMTDFKAYASRHLNAMSLSDCDGRHWARHGSTRYLWNECGLAGAAHYVVSEQGSPLAVFDGRKPLPHGRGSEGTPAQ